MKFSELNNKRKIAVQELMKVGDVAVTGTITLKQLRSWWEDYSKGEDRKVGYPMWLLNEKDFRGTDRGTYLVPLPEPSDALATSTGIKKPKTLKELTGKKKATTIEVEVPGVLSEDEFLDECRKAGIEV